MIQVGITGGIGSGKTTVCRMFEKRYQIPVYYADARAKYLMNHDPELKNAIKNIFGNVYHSNGRLNRAKLATKVFTDKSLLKKLNKLVHPAVLKDGEQWFISQKGKTHYAIKEAALLFESDSAKYLDKIIVVHVEDEERIKRVRKRDGSTAAQVKARMKNQWKQEKKMKKADFLIYNKNRKELSTQIDKIHQELLCLKAKK